MLALGLAPAAPTSADEVLLKGGGRISGVIVERTAAKVVIEAGPGRVTLPMTRVERIVEGPSPLEAYRERAAGTDPSDAAGWAELASWAAQQGLTTQSREAWQRVLQLDPGHPQANEASGRIELDGEWMSEDEAYRRRGYVPYEGRWVTPAEHEALLREREAEGAARREQREAEARVREAEARAAEAAARAREAEAAAGQGDSGIPFWWWGYGGGGIVVPPIGEWSGPPAVDPAPPARPRPPARPPNTINPPTPARPRPTQPAPGGLNPPPPRP
jgi:hypothetical protein